MTGPAWRRLLCCLAFVGMVVLSAQGCAEAAGNLGFVVDIWSRDATVVQLYFDRGDGMSEAASRVVSVPASPCLADVAAGAAPPCPPQTLAFGLPPGRYTALRLDVFVPTNVAEGLIFLRNPHLVGDPADAPNITWASFAHNDVMETVAGRFDGGLKIITHPPTRAAQFYLDLSLARNAGKPREVPAVIALFGLLGAMVVVGALDFRTKGRTPPGAATDPRLGARPIELYRPRPIVALLLALAAAVPICWPVWPGFMSLDSLYAYKEAIEGVDRSIWPPMHVYLFWLSRELGAGAWGLFVAQAVLLFFAAALIFTMWLRQLWAALVAFSVFAALFVYFPTMLGTMLVLWKDGVTAGFAVLGLALWLLALRGGRFAWLIAAVAAFGIASALRFNALPLLVFLLALICVDPLGGRRRFGRAWAMLAVALSLNLAYLSDVYRLPDLRPLPEEGFGIASTQLFDLIGISACAGEDFLPLPVSKGRPLTADELRQAYDARHLQLSFQDKPGQPALLVETDAGGAVGAAWMKVLPRHPLCYLRHRMAVFAWQMGLRAKGIFYPTHTEMIDDNPYGIALAHPAAAAATEHWVETAANQPWRRPYLLYVLAIVMTGAAVLRRVGGSHVLLAVLLGALAFLAALFIAGPAADARYLFPSNVFCALLIILAGSALIGSRRVAAAAD